MFKTVWDLHCETSKLFGCHMPFYAGLSSGAELHLIVSATDSGGEQLEIFCCDAPLNEERCRAIELDLSQIIYVRQAPPE